MRLARNCARAVCRIVVSVVKDWHAYQNAVQHELANHKCTPERIQVWQRGVDTARFNPSYKCSHMRAELSDGHPEAPLLVHVGRLGAGTAITKHACMLRLVWHMQCRNRNGHI